MNNEHWLRSETRRHPQLSSTFNKKKFLTIILIFARL